MAYIEKKNFLSFHIMEDLKRDINESFYCSVPAGLFSGVSIALVVAIIVLIHARNILRSEGRGQYMENIFPLYR